MSAEATGILIERDEIQRRRAAMDADVWLFIKWVCGHGAPDIERFHRPMAYFLAGDAVRLAASLNTYDSEIVTQIRADLKRRGIDWNTANGVKRLKRLLRRVNNRISRSMGKSLISEDVLLHTASVDPNIDILITSKSDDAAWAMCEAVGNTMRNGVYEVYYGDRMREEWITKKWIRMAGRTKAQQDTIEARGINSQSYGRHYNLICCDDLASTEAKQGDATIEDALRFIASLQGISIAERWGGTRYVFCGTIQGPKDDHAELTKNPEYISVVIPIWRHPSGAKWTVKNMMDDGVPVLPELYDVDAIREKRADTLANESRGLGRISWLQNFIMCAHESGSMQFTMDLIQAQTFTRVWSEHAQAGWLIRRYLYQKDKDGSPVPLRSSSLAGQRDCGCFRSCGLNDHAYVEFDPMTLPRNFGIDQAMSLEGDRWAIGVIAVDQFGHKYQLKGAYDKGYWRMVAAIPQMFNTYGGVSNPPQKIGVESNTWQSISTDWLKRDEMFQYLARRIEKLPPTQTAKVLRIFNDVYSGLEDGTLWLDPDDIPFRQCALDYDASAPDKQKDDPLDAVAMAIQTHKYAASALDDKALSKFAGEQSSDFNSHCDAGTWIDTSTSLYEDFAAWN